MEEKNERLVESTISEIINRAIYTQKIINNKKSEKTIQKLEELSNIATKTEDLIKEIEILEIISNEMINLYSIKTPNKDGKLGAFSKKQNSRNFIFDINTDLKKQLEEYNLKLNEGLKGLPIIPKWLYHLSSNPIEKYNEIIYHLTGQYNNNLKLKTNSEIESYIKSIIPRVTHRINVESPYEVKNGEYIDKDGNKKNNYTSSNNIVNASEIFFKNKLSEQIRKVKTELKTHKDGTNTMTINDYYNSKEAFYLKDFNKTIFPSMKTEDLYKVKISISKLIKIEISIEQYKKAINLLKEYSSPFDHSKVIIEKLKKEIIALEDERKIYETEIKDFKKHLKEQEETEKQTINTNNATNTVQNKANTTKIEKKPIAGSKSISQKSEEYVKLVELRRKIDKILLSITINDVYSYARKEGKYPKDVTSEDEKRIRKIIFNQRMSEITSYGYNYDEVISKYNQTANNIDSIKSIPVLFEKCKQELRIKGLSDEDMNKLQDDGIFTILENEFKLALEDKLKSDDLSNDLEAEIYYYLEKYTNVRKELSSFSDIETRKHLTESVKAKYFENTVLAPEISKTKSSGKGR